LRFQDSSAQNDLNYKKRFHRNEGVKQFEVSGYNIELMSLTENNESIEKLSDSLKICFFLPELEGVYITCREINNNFNYWMDNVNPLSNWKIKSSNCFTWPTSEILNKLKGINSLKPNGIEFTYELGVTLRLNRENPSEAEKIVPVILYSKIFPQTLTNYLFTFYCEKESHAMVKIYKFNSENVLFSQSLPSISPEEPFTINWKFEKIQDGWYTLVIDGQFDENNLKFKKIIYFYHHSF